MKISKFTDFLNEEKKGFTYTRGCIMLDFNVKIWDKFIKNIINKEDVYDVEGFGFEEDPHVTILYGILPDKHSPEDAKEKLLETNIDLHRYYELKHISIFESKDYDVVKFDLKDCDEVYELNKYCTEVFDYENDHPDYHPHVTIAYVKKGKGKDYIQKLTEPLIVEPSKLVYSYPNEDGSKNKKDTIIKYEPLDEIDEMNEKFKLDNLSHTDDWAIFKISKSYGKCFITELSKILVDKFSECHYQVRYSDPKVLKFTLGEAIELIKKNISTDEKMGVVNSKGVQKLFNWNIKDLSNEEIFESVNEKRYRIVSDYGHGDKSWVERMLTEDEVKEWFIKNTGWTEEDYDDVGIEHFLYADFIHTVEVDHEDDEEDWDWQDS